ncbi:MAG: Na/Pi symporter [Victivallaceae bacterium]|nr:Na/Pi symporter [Victivallaceae bacterium]
MKNLFKILPLLFVIVLSLTACSRSDSAQTGQVDKIKILQGDEQCALPGEAFRKPLRLELLGPGEPGLLGGEGEPPPAVGVKVLFVPVDGSDLKLSADSTVSDAGGGVSVKVIAGRKIGDQYLRVIAADKSILVRFITGISIAGADQECSTEQLMHEPLTVRIVNAAGRPLSGVPVYFRINSAPGGKKTDARLQKTCVLTDPEGIAETNLKVGKKTGEYNINVEVADGRNNYNIRGINVRELGLNSWAVIITVLGGLAIFIFGMKQMSDGLQKVAGEKVKKILHFFTSNRFIAVLAGAVITAVIQSSSATTVMVIGFVNAGLLNLFQAIGIIFGANIGTTVTAQIISFNLYGLALPAIAVGLVVMFFNHRLAKGWGETLLGFGLLFFGMSIMSHELKTLGVFPSFIRFFQTFDCTSIDGIMPLGAVLGAIGIGTLVTVIIQSSSASTGIILALAGSGLINFYTAVPLVIGTNIGTTITAIFASLAANRRAKQAAFAHCFFNITGAVVMLALFYVPWKQTQIPVFLYFINHITSGDVFAAVPQNIVRHIAMAHTFFNVLNVILLLPFIGIIARVCAFFIPVRDEKSIVTQALEPHLLNTPSIALEQAVQSIRYMVKEAWAMVDCAIADCFIKVRVNEDEFESLGIREEKIDRLQGEITEYLVQITRRELSDEQAELVPLLMHCTNDAERIADHTANILTLTRRLAVSSSGLSKEGQEEVNILWGILKNQAHNVVNALHGTDSDKISGAIRDENKINKLVDEYENNHIDRLRDGKCDATVGVIFIEMLAEIEKIGDHLCNIAERAPQIQRQYVSLG